MKAHKIMRAGAVLSVLLGAVASGAKKPPPMRDGSITDYSEGRYIQRENEIVGAIVGHSPGRLESCTERLYTIESSDRIFVGREVNCSNFGQGIGFKVVVGQTCSFTIRPPWRMRPEQIGLLDTKGKIRWMQLQKETIKAK